MTPLDGENCRALLARSYLLLDSREHAALANLFTEDGVWHRGGHERRGHAAILAALEERAETRRTLHVVTSATMESAGGQRISGDAHLMVTIGYGTSGRVEYWIVRDRYAPTERGWLIAERSQRPVRSSID